MISRDPELTRLARRSLGVSDRYPNNAETLHGTLPDGRKIRLLPKPARGRTHRSSDRLQVYCEGCRKWFGTGNINQHAIVHGIGSEGAIERYKHIKARGFPASLARYRAQRLKALESIERDLKEALGKGSRASALSAYEQGRRDGVLGRQLKYEEELPMSWSHQTARAYAKGYKDGRESGL